MLPASTTATTPPHLILQQLLASAGFEGDTSALFTGAGVSDHPFLAWLADSLTIDDNFLSTADTDLADSIEGKRLHEHLAAEDEDLHMHPDQDINEAQQQYGRATPVSNRGDGDASPEPSLAAVFAQATLHAAAPWLASQKHTESELRANINDLKRQISMLLEHLREVQHLNSSLDNLALSGQAERAAAEGRNILLRSGLAKLQGALADTSEQVGELQAWAVSDELPCGIHILPVCVKSIYFCGCGQSVICGTSFADRANAPYFPDVFKLFGALIILCSVQSWRCTAQISSRGCQIIGQSCPGPLIIQHA